MSLVAPLLSSDSTAIPVGTIVVLSGSTVRAFNASTDVAADSYGVVVPKKNNLVDFNLQSAYFFSKTSSYAFDGYLRYVFDQDGNNVANTTYEPNYNWTTDDACNAILIVGTAAVLNSQTGHAKTAWKATSVGTVTTIYTLC